MLFAEILGILRASLFAFVEFSVLSVVGRCGYVGARLFMPVRLSLQPVLVGTVELYETSLVGSNPFNVILFGM